MGRRFDPDRAHAQSIAISSSPVMRFSSSFSVEVLSNVARELFQSNALSELDLIQVQSGSLSGCFPKLVICVPSDNSRFRNAND